jgi:enoyl-CoA hydratase/carnithine racemase
LEGAVTVTIEKHDRVWTVVHDRPEARNAMDPESAVALNEAFLEFEADDSADVAVLTGVDGCFCAGWDLKHAASLAKMNRLESNSNVRKMSFPIGGGAVHAGALGPTRLELSKPVIAAVEGPAVAGGLELALWCDVRVMAETAYMGVFCRRWGIPLMDGGSVRLPRAVGRGRALEIAMTGRKVLAEECLQIGLCEKVVPEGQARAAAEAMAHEIARFPQMAVRCDRRSIIETYGKDTREALKLEWMNGLQATAQEGVTGAERFSSGVGRHGDFENI